MALPVFSAQATQGSHASGGVARTVPFSEVPGGIAAGNLLLLVIFNATSGDGTFNISSVDNGFSLVTLKSGSLPVSGNSGSTPRARISVYWKIATGSESGNVTVTYSSNATGSRYGWIKATTVDAVAFDQDAEAEGRTGVGGSTPWTPDLDMTSISADVGFLDLSAGRNDFSSASNAGTQLVLWDLGSDGWLRAGTTAAPTPGTVIADPTYTGSSTGFGQAAVRMAVLGATVVPARRRSSILWPDGLYTT